MKQKKFDVGVEIPQSTYFCIISVFRESKYRYKTSMYYTLGSRPFCCSLQNKKQ